MSSLTRQSAGRPKHVFQNHREAGRALAELLAPYRGNPNLVVLGLARGGVPVAWEVAASLDAPLDAFFVQTRCARA